MKPLARKLLPPAGILLAGFLVFLLLRATARPPRKVERPYRGPLVEAVPAPAGRVAVTVRGQGTVRPDLQIDLAPQVPGVVVWKSSSLESGEIFDKGTLLLRIDPRDYELAAQQAEAAVAQARYRLETARRESEEARKDWARLHPEGGEPDSLVLRLPQLRAAEAELKSARARLETARLRLSRTRIYAPFDGRTRSARVDVGQYLNPGQPIAQIYGTERAEIAVPLPDEELAWIEIPSPSSPKGSTALVSATFAGRRRQWRGRVIRTEGEIDPRSRMVRVVVSVDDPYAGFDAGTPPLTVGMFVDVAIEGRKIDGVRTLPRFALRPGDEIWTVGSEGILRVRKVQVVRSSGKEALIRVQMPPDEQVVITTLDGVTDGMKVRLSGEEAGS